MAAAGENLSTIYQDGELMTPEDEMVERLANYRMLKDRYGDNFANIYDPYASASEVLDILDGRV